MLNQVQEVEKGYKRTILFQTEYFEVVSIEWTENSFSAMHGHAWSQGAILVEEGLFEDRMDLGLKKEVRLLETGQSVHTPYGVKHEIRCVSQKGKTLHVYTPKVQESSQGIKFDPSKTSSLHQDLLLGKSCKLVELQKILVSIRTQSISTHSPYFMNQLFSGVSPQLLLAEELIAQTKTTLATHEASPVFSEIEAEVVEALGKQIGWKEGARDGVGVPGGSAANFMAIHCARQRRFPEFKNTGMNGKALQVFVSSEAHYSFKKAAVALGLGMNNIISVPVDEVGKMNVDCLDQAIQDSIQSGAIPLMVCATAGTTVLGAFDPIDEIAAITEKYKIWLHVDGAWGGPAIFSSRLKNSIRGAALADSFTFDAHKLLGAGLTCSFFLTQHCSLLLEANDVTGGDYLFHSEDLNLDRGKSSWQCGRRADALSFWTIWKSLGTKGIEEFVDQMLQLRDESVEWIKQQPRLELVADPAYLNLCVKVLPPSPVEDTFKWSEFVRNQLKNKNQCMVNYSTNQDGTFLRLILANPFLEIKQVQQILNWALEVK